MEECREKPGALVSVVVPVYNGSRHIKKCIASILKQTYQQMELMLIDDGSTDDSVSIIKKILEQYRRKHPHSAIKTVMIQQENHGAAYTRNYGISHASGEYIAFVDQDDFLAGDYLEHYISLAEGCDIVVGGYERVTDSGRIKRRVRLSGRPWDAFMVVAPWAHLYRREFLTENHIQFLTTGIGEDVYFNLIAYSETENIAYTTDTGYQWFFNTESVSNSRQNTIQETVDPLVLLESVWKDIRNRDFLQRPMVEYYFARYICWYMLFSSRGSRKSQIETMAGRLLEWLKSSYPAYRHNPYLFSAGPKGEEGFINLCVFLFYALDRVGLIIPALKCLGKR